MRSHFSLYFLLKKKVKQNNNPVCPSLIQYRALELNFHIIQYRLYNVWFFFSPGDTSQLFVSMTIFSKLFLVSKDFNTSRLHSAQFRFNRFKAKKHAASLIFIAFSNSIKHQLRSLHYAINCNFIMS